DAETGVAFALEALGTIGEEPADVRGITRSAGGVDREGHHLVVDAVEEQVEGLGAGSDLFKPHRQRNGEVMRGEQHILHETDRFGKTPFYEMLDERQVLQLQQQLSSEFQLGESRLNLKVALATVFCPKQSISSDDALRRVDIAMVHAKTSNQLWASYQQGQDESHQRELMLLHDLPYSLQSGQMFVVYQPKVAIQQPRARSAEALIRWQHPSLGFIPPDEFIRLAEHSGLISQVTDWMIEQVISQLANWSAAGFDFNVAVNLSAYDLLNPDLPQQLSQLLTKYQVAGSALALEVTEGAVMQDPQQVIRNLQQLRSMGIELAIDDFGTGQSSLAYLKQLPVHEVKIDRAFVKDIEHNQNDELIVLATTQLAHGLGLRVTAEGLENEAGLAKLLVAGVDKVQGYYFARPLKADLFLAWMQAFPTEKTTWFKET
ncbi:MAG: EAL domain-containing protein, partial [Gammaproteobacteria bacterium]|nr:EAL domain-containing protein [Gammaproteobacteria bacterium]